MRLLALGLLLAVVTRATAQDISDSGDPNCRGSVRAQQLCATDSLFADAIRHNDVKTLAQLYADDYHFTTYRGSTSNKADQLRAFRTGEMRFDSAAVSERRVRLYDCAGVVTGRRRQTATVRGETRTGENRFTHVYVWREGRWQLVASQNTPVLSAP
ncbi:MAG: nuclear transport factor 2 family protein [Gemmatimonadota bacterium]|nr:nuclear transport factor 2 family protein [Gemmatimonadota bacterium]